MSNRGFVTMDGDLSILLENNSVLTQLYAYLSENATFDVSSLSKMDSPSRFSEFVINGSGKLTGDISYINNLSHLSGINIVGKGGLSGNVDSIMNLTHLNALVLSTKELNGQLSQFTNFINLTQLVLDITGTVESLADGLYNNGKNTGNLLIVAPRATYNGTPLKDHSSTGGINIKFTESGWAENI